MAETLFSSSYQDQAARLWDTATGQPLKVFRGPNTAAQTSAFAPDGRHVVVGYLDGTESSYGTPPPGPSYPSSPGTPAA